MENQKFWFIIASLISSAIVIYYSISEDTSLQIRTIIKNGNIFAEHKNESLALKSLPDVAIHRRVWHKYPKNTWRGLQLPVIMAQTKGRLGNVLGEYASLYSLGRIYGVTVRLLPKMRSQLIPIFPNITIPVLPGVLDMSEWKTLPSVSLLNYGSAEAAAAGIFGPGRFLLDGWPCEIQLFNAFREDILKEFTFTTSLQERVREFWNKNLFNPTAVFIGIHVRRTDYLQVIKKKHGLSMPEDTYMKRAMDYYREKFPVIWFLVISDDMSYVKKAFANYTDVLFGPGSTRELDMALFTSCNHSIITVGSFGFWAAYLTGGEVVYPDVKSKIEYQFQKNWYELGQLDFYTPMPPF